MAKRHSKREHGKTAQPATPISEQDIAAILKGEQDSPISHFAAVGEALNVPLWMLFIKGLPQEFLQSPLKECFTVLVENYFRCSPADQRHLERIAHLRAGTDVDPNDLDRLSGYSGSLQGTVIDETLDEQRSVLWEAQAILELSAKALEGEFGRDWPSNTPNYAMVLRRAAATIDQATGALECGVLEDRGLAIARKRRVDEVAHG